MKTDTAFKIVELIIKAIEEVIDAVKEDKKSEDSKK